MIPDISDNKIIKGRRAAGIRICFDQQEAPFIDYVVLSQKGDKIKVDTTGSCKDLKELIKALPDSIPLYISLDGKWIIHKIIDSTEAGDELNRVLPNANKNDFIIQKFPLGEGKDYISIIRKEKLEEILGEMTSLNQFIFEVTLGPVSSFGLLPQINHSDEFSLPNYQILFKDGEIRDIRKTPDLPDDKEFSIEDDTISINYLIPFTSCINHFKKTGVPLLDLNIINEQRKYFLYKRLFQFFGWVVLCFLFASLMANYFIYEKVRNKNQLLLEQIGSNKELLKKIQQKQSLLKTREELVSNISFSHDPLFAYYSDRIAKEVPSEITLSKLELAPQEKSSINKDLIQFINNKILISGITSSSEPLDSWIRSLKAYRWISDIIIANYYDSNSEPPRFDLEIILNNKARNEIAK